ncbi:MAG: radical SAM protein [Candidatus Omnitrophota bacterium]
MNIVLAVVPLYGVDMPPLGAAYIAAVLEKEGYSTNVFCFNSELYNQARDKRFLWGWEASGAWCSPEGINRHFNVNDLLDKWSEKILKCAPKIVGLSVNSHSRVLANLLADRLKNKKKDLYVIFGGPWCTELAEPSEFNKNVDIYVRGEGEGVIPKIAKLIAGSESIRDCSIEGTIVNTGVGFKDNRANASFVDINKLPFPALHFFDLNYYTNKTEIPILFSRGCNYSCKFCTDKPMWGNYRTRNAENIIEEMIKHSSIFNRTCFKSNDLLINGDLKQLRYLSEIIINEKLSFTWGGMARARSDMSEQLCAVLRKGGCSYLTYGIESGAARILFHMGKPCKKDIIQALKNSYKSGIKVNTLWMAGYPIEKWVDVLETMLFLLRSRRYIHEFVAVSACYIPRRSRLWQERDKLRIEYDKNSDWHIGKSNTVSIRQLRRKILFSFARILGIYKGGVQ